MQLNLYSILNITEDIILEKENNINHILQNTDLGALNAAVKIVNRFHSYFHFEQSYAYLIYAYLHSLNNDTANVDIFLEKAIFQDHLNQQAINFKSELEYILLYDKAIKMEDDFLSFAIGKHAEQKEVGMLDIAIAKTLSRQMLEALDILENIQYKSHRFYLAKTLAHIELDTSLAFANIAKCVSMIESAHKGYHEFAASVYMKRAVAFKAVGQEDLSKNDMIKALDLNPNMDKELAMTHPALRH